MATEPMSANEVLESLIAEMKRYENSRYLTAEPFANRVEDAVAALIARVDALEADEARLNWVAHYGAMLRHDNYSSEPGWFIVTPHHSGIACVDNRNRFESARAAIDAARAEAGSHE